MTTDHRTPPHHYTLLILIEALLLALFVASRDHAVQFVVSAFVGVSYVLWGVMTHWQEIKPARLMLEYASVGILATVILAVLVTTR